MTTTRLSHWGLVGNRESVLSLTTHVVQTPRHSSCSVYGRACACVGGALHRLLRIRRTAELWIVGEISRSVNLCSQGAFARTSLYIQRLAFSLAGNWYVKNTTTECGGSASELGEPSLTPHRLLSPRFTRGETSRHGVGVFLWSITLRLLARCVLLE